MFYFYMVALVLALQSCQPFGFIKTSQASRKQDVTVASNKVAQSTTSEPPPCNCCVMREAPADLSYKLTIAPDEVNQQRITVKGRVFESDGKTPAKNVLMYFYHTDATGHYTKHGDEDRSSFAWWHGYHRGWLKTNDQGEYVLNTIKPAPYPDASEPAHIHTIIQAPSQKHCYYIADFVFRGDPLLKPSFWQNTDKWWHSIGLDQSSDYGGVIFSRKKGESARGEDRIMEGRRDIVLFKEYDNPHPDSGRKIGEESPAFDPQHAWGPDQGSHACPMCKYGYKTGVLYWVNTDEDWQETENWVRQLEEVSAEKGDAFKAYLIYTNPHKLSVQEVEARLTALGKKLNLERVAVTFVPSVNDKPSSSYLNKINASTRNTFIVYKRRRVFDKFVNFPMTSQNTKLLRASIERVAKS